MTRIRIKEVKAIVQDILEADKRTRDSDSLLYLKILHRIATGNGIDLNTITIPHFLLTLPESPFPGFESVRRARQKVQRECPWLASSMAVDSLRDKN